MKTLYVGVLVLLCASLVESRAVKGTLTLFFNSSDSKLNVLAAVHSGSEPQNSVTCPAGGGHLGKLGTNMPLVRLFSNLVDL